MDLNISALYVSLNTEDELIQKNAPDNNYVCSCIRCEDEILVLTATNSTNLNLYRTKDFNSYELILSNITSNALGSKLQLVYYKEKRCPIIHYQKP